MNAFDLHIKKAVGVNLDAGFLKDDVRQTLFVIQFDLFPAVQKFLIFGVVNQFFKLAEILDPLGSDFGGDQIGKTGIALFKPSAGRDAVCLVVESLRKHLVEIIHEGVF